MKILVGLVTGAAAAFGMLYGFLVFLNYYDEIEQEAIENDEY